MIKRACHTKSHNQRSRARRGCAFWGSRIIASSYKKHTMRSSHLRRHGVDLALGLEQLDHATSSSSVMSSFSHALMPGTGQRRCEYENAARRAHARMHLAVCAAPPTLSDNAIHRLKAVQPPPGMLLLDTSPRFKAGKLFLPKRVSGGGGERISSSK